MLPPETPLVRILFFMLLPLVLIGLVVVAPLFDAARSASERERAMTIRMTLFTWLLGGVLLLGLVLLPNKQRVLMMVPAFVIATVIGRVWKRARERLRREREAPNLDRMKRLN
jgi:uncharacterized membrane protein